VKEECSKNMDQENKCTIDVNNDLAPFDPYPNVVKHLTVILHCGKNFHLSLKEEVPDFLRRYFSNLVFFNAVHHVG
jgi:hypothetical protein